MLKRQVRWFSATQDLVDKDGGAFEIVSDHRAIGDQTAGFDVLAERIDRRQSKTGGETGDPLALPERQSDELHDRA